MGFFMKSEKALGFVIMNKLEFPEGYLMMGAYAFPFLIATLIIVMVIEVFVPIFCLFPMGIARPKTHPEYLKMGDWLALIGSVFYSPSCYRRPKGNVKEEEQEVEVNEVSEEKSEDSEKTNSTESSTQVEQPNSILTKLNEDEDEDEDFDD